MSKVPEFEKEIEKYRLILKEKLDSSTGEDWVVESKIEMWNFTYECELEGFWRVTMDFDMTDLMQENSIDEAIGREAFLIPYYFARGSVLERA